METLAERGILGENGFRRLAQRREGERPRTVSSGNGNLNGAVDMHVPPAGAQHRADEELLATCPPGTVRRTIPGSVLTRPSSLAESSKVWNSLHSTTAASVPPPSPHRAIDDMGDGLPPPLPPPRTNSIGNSSTWPQVTRPAAKGSAEKSILRGDLSNVLNFDKAPDETAATRHGTLGHAPAPPELLSMAPIARPSPRSSLGGGGWASTRHQEVHLASSSSSSSAVGSPAHGGSSQHHRHQRVAGSTTSDRVHVSSPPTGSRSADLSISPVSELISSPASHASDADAARPPTFISKSPVFVFRGSTSPSSSNWHSNGTSACSSPLPGQSGAHAGSDEGSGGTGEAAGGRGGEGETRDGQNGKRKRRVPSKQPKQDVFPGSDVPSIVRAAIEVFTPGKTKSGVKTHGRSSVQADCLDSKGGGLDKKEIDGVIGTCVIGANRPGDKGGELEKGGGSEEAAGMIITKMWRTTDGKRPLFSLHGDRNSDTFHELKEQQGTTPDEAHVAPVLDGGDGPFTCSQGKEEQDQQYSWGLVLKASAGKADGDVVGEHARTVPKGGTLTRLTCTDRASTNHIREARQWASPLSPQPFNHSPNVTSSRPTSPLTPRPSANVKMSQSMDTGGRMAERKLQSSLDHSFGYESESLFRRSSSDEHQRMARAKFKNAPSAMDITAMTRANALMQKKLRTVSFELLQSEQHVMVSNRALSPFLTTWLLKIDGTLTIPSRWLRQIDDVRKLFCSFFAGGRAGATQQRPDQRASPPRAWATATVCGPHHERARGSKRSRGQACVSCLGSKCEF